MQSLFIRNVIFLSLLQGGMTFSVLAASSDSATLDVILNVPEPTQYVRIPEAWAGRVNEMTFDPTQRQFYLPVASLLLRNDSGGFSAKLEFEPSLSGGGAVIPLSISVCGKPLITADAVEVLSVNTHQGAEYACPVRIRSSAIPENQPAGDYSGVIVMQFSATS